jgi:hypothetical protein
MHPERFRDFPTAFLAAVLALILSACAASPARQPETPPETPVLAQLEARLPGRYVSVRGGDQPFQHLRIERVDAQAGRELELRLTQRGERGSPARVFGLRLSATTIATRLRGELALLDASGESRRSCPMVFQAGDEGLVGETDAGQCLFGVGDETVGLLKEMAFDGSRLTIGDRLIDPASGQPRGEDRVITFLPELEFEGWAGRLEGERWRVAQSFSLAPGQGTTEPLDAADMPLGFGISLDYYRMEQNPEDILLRLTVRDPNTGEISGEAWAEPQSGRIGLALPTIQVGLERSDGLSPR